MRKFRRELLQNHICLKTSSNMTKYLRNSYGQEALPLPSELPYIWVTFNFLFSQCNNLGFFLWQLHGSDIDIFISQRVAIPLLCLKVVWIKNLAETWLYGIPRCDPGLYNPILAILSSTSIPPLGHLFLWMCALTHLVLTFSNYKWRIKYSFKYMNCLIM